MERGNDWSVRIARDIGRRVAYYRNRADLTAVMLSARCAELGLPLDRGTIAKLETGHRNSVTVDEVYVLAAALGVPPVLLLFGVGTEEPAEILPGKQVPAFRGAQWFTGEGPMPEPGDDPGMVAISGPHNSGPALPLVLYRRADKAFTEEMQATSRARVMDESAAAAADEGQRAALGARADYWRRAAEESWDKRQAARRQAEAEGIVPPPAQMSLRPGDDALIV
jgi:transcriptional regulator with XRE-family HTH domain